MISTGPSGVLAERVEPDVDPIPTCPTVADSTQAPITNITTPISTNEIRDVATQISAGNKLKNISELPRSRITISITIAAPHTTSRGSRCSSGGRIRPANRRAHNQHFTVLVQIAGKEDDHADLRRLGGLERDRAKIDAEVRAVHLLADERKPGQDQLT